MEKIKHLFYQKAKNLKDFRTGNENLNSNVNSSANKDVLLC